MNAESLKKDNYYDQFERGGVDLRLMYDVLSRLDIPADIKDSLESIPAATFLVLGSATHKNIDAVALIDRVLRPGLGQNDGVLMIDYNHYPMQHQREHWKYLEPRACSEEQQPLLPYPDYMFVQANMMELPVADETMDVVMSDYTLNFLSEYDDVTRTLGEVSRVLKPGGLLLLSVAGHEQVDGSIPLEDITIQNPQMKQREGGSFTSQFPIQLYTKAIIDNGFDMRAVSVIGNSFACTFLQKPTR